MWSVCRGSVCMWSVCRGQSVCGLYTGVSLYVVCL